jgi:hypothetical protein
MVISRMSRWRIALVMAGVAVMAMTGSALAGTPQAVTIVSHVTFNPDGPNYGDFQATGAAVRSGAMCASGTFVDTGLRFAGFQSNRGVVQVQVIKSFTCDDESGSFTVKMQIQANFDTGFESFTWVGLGGTGAYQGFKASGTGSTVPNRPIGNINTFVGFVVA